MAGLNKYQAYPEYRDSGVEWIDAIPFHWEVLPTFSLCEASTKKNIDGAENNVLSLSYGNIIPKDIETNFGLLPESFNTYQIVENGDIILRLTDLQNDKNSLRVGLAKQKGIITSAYLKLSSQGSMLSEYLYRLLHSYDTTKVFYGMGGGLRQSMKFEDFRRLPLLLPSKNEQGKIIDFLDHETTKIDNLIEKQQQLIELLKEKRQAVISHAVTKGLNPDVPMKDSGVAWLGKIPKHWELSKLRYMFRFGKGLTITKEHLQDEGVPCVNYGEIHSKFGFEIDPQIHKLKCVDESYILNNPDSLIYKGDIIFADTSEDIDGAGNFTQLISNNQIFAGYHTIILRPLNRESLRFYAYILDSKALRAQISNAVKGVKVFSITQAILRSTSIWFPPLSERERIVAFLDNQTIKIDTLIEKQLQQIDLLKERRTALISAAVTGKIDLRNWTAPIPKAETPTEASA
ncbi:MULTISPECIES: restriction endonuclease subunit S [unclassified Pseudocitrobacter]|uniref:restriction endonuclease subunit S n=1 Tax=unclassified Pseudocitrobacter TaxID=2638778 RepID=UPI0023E46112|nr:MULTISPECIES: restriction endonuclease subunit S [unclassified Pseudocitrobacter]MDF3828300.1 restriction endonuclease subunit S [Pseudocitrobacter sp. 2023EL-00150]MEC5374455.1 restriction endonuclease subunit S [Pseudocitrobacter sp. MW920760]